MCQEARPRRLDLPIPKNPVSPDSRRPEPFSELGRTSVASSIRPIPDRFSAAFEPSYELGQVEVDIDLFEFQRHPQVRPPDPMRHGGNRPPETGHRHGMPEEGAEGDRPRQTFREAEKCRPTENLGSIRGTFTPARSIRTARWTCRSPDSKVERRRYLYERAAGQKLAKKYCWQAAIYCICYKFPVGE